ncbi:hypothetical protein [Mycobacterium tuberculosis]|uniref:hypothetical protein n=1 Tax=Mycobacterium tuberculosis TaxID=1773 RepID=UPI00272BFEDF|nr:hypothetical protein [Mycobacterium tuberculosis]
MKRLIPPWYLVVQVDQLRIVLRPTCSRSETNAGQERYFVGRALIDELAQNAGASESEQSVFHETVDTALVSGRSRKNYHV